MQLLNYMRLIWDYNYWGQHKLLHCLSTISQEDFECPVPYSIGSLHQQAVHTMWAEALWLYHRIQGQSRLEWTTADFPTLESVRQQWTQVERDWRSYLAALTESDLDRAIEVKRLSGEVYHHTVAEILIHVVNHGTDHRGQMLRLIHDFGGETFGQDMIAYFREKNEGANHA